MRNRRIYFMERNHRGAWVVYGVLGIRQYYTKKRARELYMDEVKEKTVICKSIS